MKKILFSGLILTILFIASGCGPSCPSSCNDYDKCTNDDCSKTTNFGCIHTKIIPCDGNDICEEGEYGVSTDCPNCEDNNLFTKDKYDYLKGNCEHENLTNQEIVTDCKESNNMEVFVSTCIGLAAMIKGDPALCNEILKSYSNGDGEISRDYCIVRIAVDTRDGDLLKQVEKGHLVVTEWVTNLAVKQENYSICEMIQYSVQDKGNFWIDLYMKKCFKEVYQAKNAYTTTKCEGVSDTNKNLCLNALQ